MTIFRYLISVSNHRPGKLRTHAFGRAIVFLICGLTLSLTACSKQLTVSPSPKTLGKIEVWDEALLDVISSNAQIEILADGFQWSEGPAWDPQRQQLYFSDVPQNKAYVWSESGGLKPFLDPSGISNDRAEGFREPGSNGLMMMPNGQLMIANHGKRALEVMNIDTKERTTVINSYEDLSLNSPNDMALSEDGTVFFTDPPYGLSGINASPLKELSFNGVYKLSQDGELKVIDGTQSFPNGIALSPDETRLYVAVSDPEAPKIMRYTRSATGEFENPQLWFDAKPYLEQGLPGLPDGMAVADNGYVFATGPGGVFILSPEGKAFGQIHTGRATANCTFGDDGKTLYITAGDSLVRVRLMQGIDI